MSQGTTPGCGITLSNADCYFMKLGNSTVDRLDTSTPLISVLAGGRVVNGSNGLPDQGGDGYFLQRFALRSSPGYEPSSAMRFALEHQNPLITEKLTADSETYPEKSYSFLSISDPGLILWSLKPPDDAKTDGIIARMWNISDKSLIYALKLSADSILRAKRLSHIETPKSDIHVANGEVRDSIKAHQLKTIQIHT